MSNIVTGDAYTQLRQVQIRNSRLLLESTGYWLLSHIYPNAFFDAHIRRVVVDPLTRFTQR